MSSEKQEIDHNEIFSLKSAEERYELCRKVAESICKGCGLGEEIEEVTQALCLYLCEKGHTIRKPEHEGVICKILKKVAKGVIRKIWEYRRENLTILDDNEEHGHLADTNFAIDQLKKIALEKIKKLVEEDAKDAQGNVRIALVGEMIAKGYSQIETAQFLNISQSQVSRDLKKYKTLFKPRFEMEFPGRLKAK